MPLLKVCEGLIEEDNYWLNTNFIDFLGSADYEIIENLFHIYKGVIKRSIPYCNFLIELKEKYEPKSLKDTAFFYVSNGENFGILEKYSTSKQDNYCYWKIIYYDGFLQTYKSIDNKIWINMGGTRLNNITLQGFEIKGDTPFTIETYRIYKSPYITIYNYPNNFKAELLDEENNIIKQKLFSNNKCMLFLDYCFLGKIRIFDTNNIMVYSTNLIQLNYGDEFFLSSYDIEMYYEQTKVDCNTVLIKKSFDKVIVKNTSSQIYENLNILVSKPKYNTDIINLSLNNIDFFDKVVINRLNSNEVKELYLKIESNKLSENIKYKDFSINIV